MPKVAANAVPNELLVYEREQRHWTQEDVAERIEGLGDEGPKTVGRWERGIIKPSPHYLRKLAALYGRSIEELGYTKGDRIPFFNVPYLRNPYFTGREAILAQLHELLLSARQSKNTLLPQALVGLGGVGKTQTATEYAYRHMHDYHTIVWLRADSLEVLASDFASIASLLNLPVKCEQDQNRIISTVKRWFTEMSRWLLIFDNADFPDIISDFLPSPCYGHILLTTRSRATGTYAQPIEVGEMAPEEGTHFLLRRAKVIGLDASSHKAPRADYNDAQAIAQALGGLPLAIDQAGAYIEETGSALSRYATLYTTYRDTLLQYRGDAKKEYPHSVATTWSLAFEQVHAANPTAGELLSLFAFLAPDAIPEEIITKGAAILTPHLQPLAANPLSLDFASKELLRYSLVRRNAGTFTLHRLVQSVLKDRMDENTQRLWAERAVRTINSVFPDVKPANWPTCQHYLPQVEVCADLIEQWNMQFVEAARLLYQTGYYLRERAQFAQAERLFKRALTIREQILGPKHLEVAVVLDALAGVYLEQGRYPEAESLHQRVLAIREKALGPDHPDMATTLTHLAHLRYFIHTNTYDEAGQLFLQALAIREKALGTDHPDTALTLVTLGHLYSYQGKYEQALSLYLRSLSILERVLDLGDLDLVDCLYSIGSTYHRMGKYDQAEIFYNRALTMSEALGSEHPQVGLILDNMGILYMHRSIYDQSEQYFKRSLATHEKVLGMVHPHIAKCLDNFALLYLTLAKYAEAETLAQRALSIHEQTVGPEHTDVAIVLSTLTSIYLAEGKYTQTASALQRGFAVLEKDHRPNNPFLAQLYINSGQLSFSQGRYDEAEMLYRKGLAIFEQTFGAEHREVAETLNKMARLFLVQGTYDQAEVFCQRALAIWEKKLGPDHSDTAQGLATQALLLYKQKKLAEAEVLCTRAGAIYLQALGAGHPNVAFCLSILAELSQAQGDYSKASALYQRALEIWLHTVEAGHVDMVACKKRYEALLQTMEVSREVSTDPE